MSEPKVSPSQEWRIVHPLSTSQVESVAVKGAIHQPVVEYVSVDLTKATPPSREFACDVCTLVESNGEIRFIFGQVALASDDLDSALVVKVNALSAKQLCDSIWAMNKPGLAEIAKGIGIVAAPLYAVTSKPRQMAMVVANVGSVGVSGYESTIDFYRITPFAMRKAQVCKEVNLEPVVRVDVQTSQFLSLATRLLELTANTPSMMKDA